ncbi:non-ribosomal peptide synthetase [Nonomuraea wenchangensis]|uniref:non-ribosomal peptide synthetase n=1 Tax=Nonomuraea wenchangensis TaxID=568860 RepID=UPI00384D6B71
MRRNPDAVAVEHGGPTSYRALADLAAECGSLLRAHGLVPGSRVGIAVPRSLPMIAALIAIWDCGSVPVPLPSGGAARHVRRIVENCEARLVLTTDPKYASDGITPTVWAPYSVAVPHEPVPPVPITASDTAYILYTSGSTGTPKGIVMSHGAFAGTVDWQVRSTAATHAGRVPRQVQFTPLTFDVSLLEIFATFASGGTLLLPDESHRRDPALLLDMMARSRATSIFLPHVMLHAVADAAKARVGEHLPPLRQLLTGGEQLIVTDQLRTWMRNTPGCVVQNIYGPSETHVVTSHILDGDPASWPALPPIGKAVSGATLRIVGENGEPVATGETGELHISGPCLADGYLGAPELTAQRFLTDGTAVGRTYRSGDQVTDLGDGTLQYVGRIDGQIKIRGAVVDPTAVEAVLTEHPEVRTCAVVARERMPGQKHLVAYVVPTNPMRILDGADLTVEHGDTVLHRHLLDRLSEWSVPDTFVFLESLPLGSSGKINRAALPEPPRRRSTAARTAETRAETPAETRLIRIWSRLLNLDDVGTRDRFFEIGGDSVLLVRLQKEIVGEFGMEVRIADLIELATIQAIASRLSGGDEEGGPATKDRQSGDRRAAFRARGRQRRAGNRDQQEQ